MTTYILSTMINKAPDNGRVVLDLVAHEDVLQTIEAKSWQEARAKVDEEGLFKIDNEGWFARH